MRSIPRADVVMVCCSVLQAEVQSLRQPQWPDRAPRLLPSMMHMHPGLLAASLRAVLEGELRQGHGVVLVYGDCCPQMRTLEAMPGVARTRGKSCFELLLGPEEYRRLSQEGAFFLLAEWALRWKEIFAEELGLDRANATSLMQDLHRKLVYLDTGVAPVPNASLKACAEYCGLPCEVRPVPLERLRLAIEDALLRCMNTGATA